MANFSVNLPDPIEEKFRAEVAVRKGMKKGNITIALCEAIELWLKEGKKK